MSEEIDISALVKGLKEATEASHKATDGIKEIAEKAMAEAKTASGLSESTREKADEALTKLSSLQNELSEIAQKFVKAEKSSEQAHPKSMGELFMESPKAAELSSGFHGKLSVSMSRKTITSAATTVGSGVSAGTSLVPGQRLPGIISLPDRRLTVRDLLMAGTTSSSSIEYPVETSFTNAAAPVAENTTKPYSDLVFNLKTTPVRTIAHMFKAARQIMDDAPGLQSYIDGRARYGLQLAEEKQLLSGDGTGQNLLGIIPQATAFAAPTGASVTDATALDNIRLAILQGALSNYPMTGIVLHLTDWANIEMQKDTLGRYLISNPQEGSTPRLWGLPVVSTQSITAGQFLVGAFNMGAQIFDRMEMEVLLSTENADDFEKNMISIRAEERLALAVYRPAAFIYGALATASSGG